ncbi:MAG: M20 family metallopeptidase [bacterium]|nr:M20 family metallopeptidase [bacterium]
METYSAQFISELVHTRRTLHAMPEVAFNEHKTAAFILNWLSDYPELEIVSGIGGTGIIATLNPGKDGPVVVLRTDMDALPVNELTGLPWQSNTPGVMHACGHDGHMTCMLGAIKVLYGIRNELSGQVKFLFQPAEEVGRGAREIISSGQLDGATAVFGFHNLPTMEKGMVATIPGAVVAGSHGLDITVRGHGTHAAFPQEGIDSIFVATQILSSLYQIPGRFFSPLENIVISIGHINAGTVSNIIPAEVRIKGTIRTLSAATSKRAVEIVQTSTEKIAEAYGAKAIVSCEQGLPVGINNNQLLQDVHESFFEAFGPENYTLNCPPGMFSEDFSCYSQVAPSLFTFIGTKAKDDMPFLHSPYYDFDDEIIGTGVKYFVTAARSILG